MTIYMKFIRRISGFEQTKHSIMYVVSSNNSEAFASELLEDLEEMFPRYW